MVKCLSNVTRVLRRILTGLWRPGCGISDGRQVDMSAEEQQRDVALVREHVDPQALDRTGMPSGSTIRFASRALESVAHFVTSERRRRRFFRID